MPLLPALHRASSGLTVGGCLATMTLPQPGQAINHRDFRELRGWGVPRRGKKKEGGLRTDRTVNTTRDRPDRSDAVAERENKADSFHFTLRCQRIEGEGE